MPKPNETEPKPIFWIGLPQTGPENKEPVPHSRFSGLSGHIELHIEVESEYLYVGSGEFGLFKVAGGEQAYYTFARHNGHLIIPGTGLKGAVRSIVEAISNSCVRQAARGEQVRSSHTACQDPSALCPACRLFGTTGYRGRVHFSDAAPVSEVETQIIKISDLWPPRLAKGRKFYEAKVFQAQDMQPERSHRFIEVVGKGAHFSARLYLENVTEAEMGLIIRALGIDRSRADPDKVVRVFPVKVGGAKPRCLGAVHFSPQQAFVVSESSGLFASLHSGATLSPIQECLKKWLEDDSLLDRKAWQDFRGKARPRQEPCPK